MSKRTMSEKDSDIQARVDELYALAEVNEGLKERLEQWYMDNWFGQLDGTRGLDDDIDDMLPEDMIIHMVEEGIL